MLDLSSKRLGMQWFEVSTRLEHGDYPHAITTSLW
jgi:hypothetical protein